MNTIETRTVNELALFAGVGGGLLGSHILGWRPVCTVEISTYCREVLLRRQRDGLLPLFPIWDDVRTFDGSPWSGIIDVITGGFPCQPWSSAGNKLGSADERNLWPDTIRIIREVRPRYALLENVPGLLHKSANGYFGIILKDLAESGYNAVWDIFPASAIGAPHKRERLFILCYPAGIRSHDATQSGIYQEGNGDYSPWPTEPKQFARSGSMGSNLQGSFSDTTSSRLERRTLPEITRQTSGQLTITHQSPIATWWASESRIQRVSNDVANRVDRLKAIGNGQVAPVVVLAWNSLIRLI